MKEQRLGQGAWPRGLECDMTSGQRQPDDKSGISVMPVMGQSSAMLLDQAFRYGKSQTGPTSDLFGRKKWLHHLLGNSIGYAIAAIGYGNIYEAVIAAL